MDMYISIYVNNYINEINKNCIIKWTSHIYNTYIYTYPYIFDPSAYCIYTDVYKIFPWHKYTYIFTHINIT